MPKRHRPFVRQDDKSIYLKNGNIFGVLYRNVLIQFLRSLRYKRYNYLSKKYPIPTWILQWLNWLNYFYFFFDHSMTLERTLASKKKHVARSM